MSLKQTCMVWGVSVVLFVLLCGVVGWIVDSEPTTELTTEDVVQQLIDAIEDTMVYPKEWWSDRTLLIYYREVSEEYYLPCTPAKRIILEARLKHYYAEMVERGIYE